MKKATGTFIVFICSLFTLLISLQLFWNMGVFVDAYGTNPSAVAGGDFWNMMNWLRLALLAVITFVSGIQLVQKIIERGK